MKTVKIIKNTKKVDIDKYEADLKKKLDELGICYNQTNPDIEPEAFIVLGGDGTILHNAGSNLPLLGINFGNVGYMSELEKDELCLLEALANDKYDIEERMMIDIFINDGKNERYIGSALNEAVLSKGSVSRMIDIEYKSCGRDISVFSADGLIIATPTGSSAYSMAAGGPIIDPTLELLCLTPVCPHSLLNSRSLIFPPSSVVEMRILPTRGKRAYLSIDGGKTTEINSKDTIIIKKSLKKTVP